jgi:hypothetical protein
MKDAQWIGPMTAYGPTAAICMERLGEVLERLDHGMTGNTQSLEIEGHLYFKDNRWTWRGRWRPMEKPTTTEKA